MGETDSVQVKERRLAGFNRGRILLLYVFLVSNIRRILSLTPPCSSGGSNHQCRAWDGESSPGRIDFQAYIISAALQGWNDAVGTVEENSLLDDSLQCSWPSTLPLCQPIHVVFLPLLLDQ